MACLQYGSERRDRVQRGGKARIERHLNDSLDDFLARRADIERGGEMYFQLWSGIPHDRQRGDRRQFARLQVETGTAVNVAEAEFDDVAAEVGSKVREAGDNRLAGSAVNLGQPGRAAFETIVGHGSLLSNFKITDSDWSRFQERLQTEYGLPSMERPEERRVGKGGDRTGK